MQGLTDVHSQQVSRKVANGIKASFGNGGLVALGVVVEKL
jgi:hypothetical protein